MGYQLNIIVSAVAVALMLLHQFVAKIDTITLILIAIAILPWVLNYIKGFEIPGVVKIDLADAKAATDKVTRTLIQPPAGELSITGQKPGLKVGAPNDPFLYLRTVYETDPNLALVALRIEIEKRLRELARANGFSNENVSLWHQIRQLTDRQVISLDTGTGLMEIIALGNRAAHGAVVSSDAAAWLRDIGPHIILQLDALLRGRKPQP